MSDEPAEKYIIPPVVRVINPQPSPPNGFSIPPIINTTEKAITASLLIAILISSYLSLQTNLSLTIYYLGFEFDFFYKNFFFFLNFQTGTCTGFNAHLKSLNKVSTIQIITRIIMQIQGGDSRSDALD